MNEISLPALDGRSALGFLAGLGTAQLLSDIGDDIKLCWSSLDASAQLLSTRHTTIDQVVETLRSVTAAISDGDVIPGAPGLPPAGEGAGAFRLPPVQLRQLVENLRKTGDPAAVDRWTGALVTDLARDGEGRGQISLYAAPSGQQSLYTILNSSLMLVRGNPSYLREAFVGWRRVDDFSGEYLDHRVLFDAADSPLGKSRERGVPGATWLALMSFPLIRTTSLDGARPVSTGWYSRGKNKMRLRWPLWTRPLDLPGIQALWESPLLTQVARADDRTSQDERRAPAEIQAEKRSRDQLAALSVFAVYRAERRQIPGRTFAGVLVPV